MAGGQRVHRGSGLLPQPRRSRGATSDRPEYARLLATVDPHSPPEFRSNGTLSNLSEFAAALKCQPTDKMVQKNRCVVW